jgi:hypothetical protein
MKNVPNLPYLPSSNNYCTIRQSAEAYHRPNSTLVKGSTTRPTGSTVMQVNHDIVLRPSTGPRTNRQINKRKTRTQIVDPTYHMDDDSTEKQIIFQHPQFIEKFPQFKMKFPQKERKRLKSRQWTLMKHTIIWDIWVKWLCIDI